MLCTASCSAPCWISDLPGSWVRCFISIVLFSNIVVLRALTRAVQKLKKLHPPIFGYTPINFPSLFDRFHSFFNARPVQLVVPTFSCSLSYLSYYIYRITIGNCIPASFLWLDCGRPSDIVIAPLSLTVLLIKLFCVLSKISLYLYTLPTFRHFTAKYLLWFKKFSLGAY